jgi:hypothetical protein
MILYVSYTYILIRLYQNHSLSLLCPNEITVADDIKVKTKGFVEYQHAEGRLQPALYFIFITEKRSEFCNITCLY